MEQIERQTTVMNIDEFIEEVDRRGTINDINDLYEDSYKELYLDMAQLYKYEVQKNEDLKEIIAMYKCLVKDAEIIEQMNEYIKIRQNKIARVVSKYERRNHK